MRVALHRKGRKVGQRSDTLRVANFANPFEAAANLGDFGIYQALSRSLRTASADDMDKVAVCCWANRARNAAIVGRSAI